MIIVLSLMRMVSVLLLALLDFIRRQAPHVLHALHYVNNVIVQPNAQYVLQIRFNISVNVFKRVLQVLFRPKKFALNVIFLVKHAVA